MRKGPRITFLISPAAALLLACASAPPPAATSPAATPEATSVSVVGPSNDPNGAAMGSPPAEAPPASVTPSPVSTPPPRPAVGAKAGQEAYPIATPTPASMSGGAPCRRATKGDSPVAKACREGGLPHAKAVMKDLVKRARQAGSKFQCDECHSDPGDQAKLTADAPERFKKLLAAAGQK